MHQVNPVDRLPTCDASFASGPVDHPADYRVVVTDDLIALLKWFVVLHGWRKERGDDTDTYLVPTHDPAPVLNFVVPEDPEPEEEPEPRTQSSHRHGSNTDPLALELQAMVSRGCAS